jgi:hypothetical protein
VTINFAPAFCISLGVPTPTGNIFASRIAFIPVSVSIGITDYDFKDISNENAIDIIKNLMITASIASTKAKGSNKNLVIIKNLEMMGKYN